MLSLSKITSSSALYYLATLPPAQGTAKDDVHGQTRRRLVEPAGYWLGQASSELGLEVGPGEELKPRDLRNVLAARHPATGCELLAPHSAALRRVAAFDCTFSTPKSVSLLHALGPETASPVVRAAHDDALAAALGYLEREATRVTLSVGGARRQAGASGIVAAVFPHRLSRAPDPHLHSHVLVANLVPSPDGAWRALDARVWYRELRTAGALYETQLRANLTRDLGVRFRQLDGRAWADISGIDNRWVEEFSRRSAEIRSALGESQLDSRAADIVARSTRPPKDFSVSFEEHLATWRERGYRVGLATTFLSRSIGRPTLRPSPVSPSQPTEREWAKEAVQLALVHSPDRSFSRGDLVRARCATAPEGLAVAEVERDIDDLLASRILAGRQLPGRLQDDGLGITERARAMVWQAARGHRIPVGRAEVRYTTNEILERERSLVGSIESDHEPFSIICYTPSSRIDALDVLSQQFRNTPAAIALAPGHRAARAFESLTGIPSDHRLDQAAEIRPSLVVVDAHRFDLEALERLVLCRPAHLVSLLVPEAALAMDPVLSDLSAKVRIETVARSAALADPDRGIPRPAALSLGDTRVIVVDGPLRAVHEAIREANEDGPHAVVVTAEVAVARHLRSLDPALTVLDASQLAALSASAVEGHERVGHERVVVVGGATELRLSQKVLDSVPRTHVVTVPDAVREGLHEISPRSKSLHNPELRARLGELVRPSYLVAALGVPQKDPRARSIWRDGAAIVERHRMEHSHHDPRLPFDQSRAASLDRARVAELRRACRDIGLMSLSRGQDRRLALDQTRDRGLGL